MSKPAIESRYPTAEVLPGSVDFVKITDFDDRGLAEYLHELLGEQYAEDTSSLKLKVGLNRFVPEGHYKDPSY